MDFDLNEAIAMLLAHSVDFEVMHGMDYKGEVRIGIIAQLSTPTRLNFGDEKHGRRVSRIHVADNHKQMVTPADFKAAVKAYKVDKQWRAKTSEFKDKVSYAI